ncbi:MAG: acetyltransferase [Sphingobacteriales bacterium]|nr:MAG: acetyltransferase [Sphingobacteriales bacterium]
MLYGASGHCKVVIELLKANGVQPEFILDDFKDGSFWGFLVRNPEKKLIQGQELIISVGDNRNRKIIYNKLMEHHNVVFTIASHTSAVISYTASIRSGTVLMPGAVVNADSMIGHHCIINTNASVDHECVLGDFVHVSPNASLCGLVTIGEGTHIGAGAVILPGINIGKWCRIGAGTVVLHDVPDGCTVVGNPGRVIKTEKEPDFLVPIIN